MTENNPSVFVSQPSKQTEGSEWHFKEPNLIEISGDVTHLWADGSHYVTDKQGGIKSGQIFVSWGEGSIIISEILEVHSKEEIAIVRHFFGWIDGEVEKYDNVERWDPDLITGDFERAMGDTSETEFMKKVDE